MFSQPMVITDVGITLLLRAAGGEEFTFTKFQVGDGILGTGETPKTMTALKHVTIDDIGITKAEATEDDGYIQLEGRFDNQTDVQSDFYWREIGLIAEDGDSNEYLYAYGYDNTSAELIKAGGSSILIEQYISAIIAVGESENITANVIPTAEYASKASFDAHLADHSNPHDVNYSQVGAAAAVHMHSAADITSGVLPIARGGTGVNTLAALQALMGGKYVIGVFTGDMNRRKNINLGFKPDGVLLFSPANIAAESNNILVTHFWYFAPQKNVYKYGDPASFYTCDADTLFSWGNGGAAVTDNGFAVGYGNNGNTSFLNLRDTLYAFIAGQIQQYGV